VVRRSDVKWSNLWKVLKVISENAPMIIAAIQAAQAQKDKDKS
jgi:hypothetical protein